MIVTKMEQMPLDEHKENPGHFHRDKPLAGRHIAQQTFIHEENNSKAVSTAYRRLRK